MRGADVRHESGTLQAVELQTSAAPAASIIWLHGLGADGYDFVPLVRQLELLQAPAARYVFPHAPTRPVTINGGYVMRAWYDILGNDLVRREDEQGIETSGQQVEALIEREVERGTPRARIVLAGFSQGGAITLHTGLRQREPLAGLLALSTYLPLAERFDAERDPASALGTDLHGPRPRRPCDPAGTRGQFARSPAGCRISSRMARIRDAALALRGRGPADRRVPAARARLTSVRARPRCGSAA